MSDNARACRLRLWRERAGIDAATIAELVAMSEAEYLRCETLRHSMHAEDREALRLLFDDEYGASYLLSVPNGEHTQRERDGMDRAFRATLLRWTGRAS